MKAQLFEEYHKHGCHFFGNLAVVNYVEDMEQDPQWGAFNAGLTCDYLARARALINERYGATEELLSMPELVVRLK